MGKIDKIQLPQDPELDKYLSHLGIEVEGNVLTRQSVKDAGLDYDFFIAFAKLTQSPSNNVSQSVAVRLLTPRTDEQALPMIAENNRSRENPPLLILRKGFRRNKNISIN